MPTSNRKSTATKASQKNAERRKLVKQLYDLEQAISSNWVDEKSKQQYINRWIEVGKRINEM